MQEFLQTQKWTPVFDKDMAVKDLRLILKCTQKEFAKKYGIPVRTLEDWECRRRNCPAHVELQLQRAVDREIKSQ